MKYLKSFFIFFFLGLWFQFGYSQTSRYVQLASFKFETPYFDRVEILKDSHLGPGDFHKVNIFNHDKLVFSLDEVLDSAGQASPELKNLSKTDLFFLFKSDENYIFMFVGYPFASDPEKMILIRAGKQGLIKFFEDEFAVSDISRANANTLLLNGRAKISQGLVPNRNNFVISTYAPHWIYQLNNRLTLDSVRSVKWNKENYVFRGFSADYDIWIASPRWNAPKGTKAYVFKEKGAEPPK